MEITALFLDMRDFTGYAERPQASVVVSVLNELFEKAVPIIRSHGGQVDKFIGDGLLAVFGAPKPLDNHAKTAVHAATDIAVINEDINSKSRVGIGVNSGIVVAGSIGGSGRLEFTVIGDVVNVAARVEAVTRSTGDTILLTDETRRLLSVATAKSLISRGRLTLKGKSVKTTLHTPGKSVG